MNFVDTLLLAAGGFIGAVLRYAISQKLNRSNGFPIGTVIVNLAGALLIGFVFGLKLPLVWTLFIVSGFAGALTTFSTLNKELILLWQGGHKKAFYAYLLMTYVFGIILTYIGFVSGGKL